MNSEHASKQHYALQCHISMYSPVTTEHVFLLCILWLFHGNPVQEPAWASFRTVVADLHSAQMTKVNCLQQEHIMLKIEQKHGIVIIPKQISILNVRQNTNFCTTSMLLVQILQFVFLSVNIFPINNMHMIF